VPAGGWNGGIQSDDAVGEDVVAGVLGAHRVCVRKIFNFAEGKMRDCCGDGGIGDDFCGDARIVDCKNAVAGEASASPLARTRRKRKAPTLKVGHYTKTSLTASEHPICAAEIREF